MFPFLNSQTIDKHLRSFGRYQHSKAIIKKVYARYGHPRKNTKQRAIYRYYINRLYNPLKSRLGKDPYVLFNELGWEDAEDSVVETLQVKFWGYLDKNFPDFRQWEEMKELPTIKFQRNYSITRRIKQRKSGNDDEQVETQAAPKTSPETQAAPEDSIEWLYE